MVDLRICRMILAAETDSLSHVMSETDEKWLSQSVLLVILNEKLPHGMYRQAYQMPRQP